jgi:hypothetical protein
MLHLRPAILLLREQIEAGDRGGSHEFVDTILRYNDVNILRDAANVAVPPDRPSTTNDRFAIARPKYLVQRSNHSPVPARQILRLEHSISPLPKGVGQFKLAP